MGNEDKRINREYVKGLLRKRLPNMHKGDFGHTLIVAGSPGMTGAAAFSAKSALRSGAGLVYVMTAPENFKVIQILVPEAICVTEEAVREKMEKKLPASGAHFDDYDAVAFGPGTGTGQAASDLLRFILDRYDGPVVLDADGLNLIAGDDELREKFFTYEGEKVITPHQGEAARLLAGARLGAGEREDVANALTVGYNCMTVLKGHETLAARRNGTDLELMRNTTGDPGMATAGSGDVLTGMIASFAGQGMPLWDAACAGVYLHGLAGDLASKDKGEYGMIASDIIENIPYAIKEFV